MKKVFFMGALVCMAALAFAGGGGQKGGTGGGGAAPTLIWWQVGNNTPDLPEANRVISDYIEPKIGARLEIKMATWGEVWDKFRTIINSGEYFDIMHNDLSMYNYEASRGAWADLTALLPQQAPDLWNYIPQSIWSGVKVNGKFFAVPTYKDSAITGYAVWDDVYVKKYNIDITKTKEADFDRFFRAMKAGEGARFYPLLLNRDAGFYCFRNYDTLAGSGTSLIGVKLDDKSRKVVFTLEQPDVQEYYGWLHTWYKDGIINPDAPQVTEPFRQRPFFFAQGWPGADIIWQNSEGVAKYDIQAVFGPFLSTDSIQGSVNSISANSKNTAAALKFLQIANLDPTLRDMLAYGIEGKTFQYTDSSRKVVRRTDGGNWGLAAYQQATFYTMSPQEGQPSYEAVKVQTDSATPSVVNGFSFNVESVTNELAACRLVWDKYKYNLSTGAADLKDILPQMTAELKSAGIDKVIAEAQKQIDAFFK
jgi:putative aldouronate transport system substrate-binding protein